MGQSGGVVEWRVVELKFVEWRDVELEEKGVEEWKVRERMSCRVSNQSFKQSYRQYKNKL